MSTPSFPVPGGCACGAIRYALTEDLLGLHVCHCSDCQAATGSAFVMTAPVRTEAIELTRGEPVVHEYETVSGIRRADAICGHCTSPLWSISRRYPALRSLRPGTLDDRSWLEPVAHIWLRSAQPWVPIPADRLRFDQQPPDDLELVRAWRHRNT